MHTADDENYQRGYEWWLMVEAKKRNPNIKLYGLSWAYPAWVGNGTGSPYKHPNLTAGYICKWIKGAKDHYNLTIDYVGIWNERNYDSNYVKVLRKTLDSYGFKSTEIVAADTKFAPISSDILSDKDLASAVSIIGSHYTGTLSSGDAVKTGKPLWASEDYSTFNDDVGAGCWARILNENYINGYMTSTISWNLIASYYSGLPYFRDGLMTAIEPWSGSYTVSGTIWVTAHTTQFVQPGYYYLKHGSGSGKLQNGGSYVTLVDKNNPKDLTIVIETMTHNHSKCVRPYLLPYTVTAQSATFILKGNFSHITSLNAWLSKPAFNGDETDYFVTIDAVQVSGGKFTAHLDPDTILTLSTSTGQKKGSYGDVPPSKPFPIPYKDDFEKYDEYSEADYFADQTGVWEIRQDSVGKKGKVMEQVITQRPITWCNDADQPISIIGDVTWKNVNASINAMLIDDGGLFLAALVDNGGCQVRKATGVFFWINSHSQQWTISSNLSGSNVVKRGDIAVKRNQWYTLNLNTQKEMVTVQLDNVELATTKTSAQAGFVGIGTSSFIRAAFDDIQITDVS
ncbi:galactocerebrosidase-like isoform X2 [Dysidea avara]